MLRFDDVLSKNYIKTVFDDNVCQTMIHGVHQDIDKCLSVIKNSGYCIVVKDAPKRAELKKKLPKATILTLIEFDYEKVPSNFTILDTDGMRPVDFFKILYWAGWDEKCVFVMGGPEKFQNLLVDAQKVVYKGNFKSMLESALTSLDSVDFTTQ
jgi:hypothetical protein